MAYSEDDLWSYRIQGFLQDSVCSPLSADIATRRAEREVALAEIDGIFAGLHYLEKTEVHLSAAPTIQGTGFDVRIPTYFRDFREITSCPLPDLPEELFLVDSTQTSKATQQQEDASRHQKKTFNQKERAWLGLRSLRQGIQSEFLKLENLRSASTCPKIAKLGDYYPDAEALGQMGILTYRDVLHGYLPETLAEVFSFACLSSVISTLLFREGHIRSVETLAGLDYWRDCIYDNDEKLALDTLTSLMWPQNVRGGDHQPDGRYPNGDSRPVDTALRYQDSFSFMNDAQACSDSNKASEALRQAADLTSAGLEFLSAPSASESMSNLEQNACDLLGICHEEFNFAQFGNMEEDSNISGFETFVDPHAGPYFTDLRDPTRSCIGPIPGYSSSPFCSPMTPLPTELPFHDSPSHTDDLQPKIEPRSLRRTFSHPIHTLRNTDMFLVVLAFGKEHGTEFFLLSGSGQTVACERRGSALNTAKSKQERHLQEGFFEPLKRIISKTPSFLALLSVAERFVLLGNFASLQEVHVFLFHIAEPFLDHLETVRVFQHEVEKQLNGSPSLPSKTREVHMVQGSFRCTSPGCKKIYKDTSGLSKHKKARHQGGARNIQCPDPGCGYISHRRDAVRQHFTRCHCSILPPSLQERRPRHL